MSLDSIAEELTARQPPEAQAIIRYWRRLKR